MPPSQIFMLVGPKGSGKSHIGRLLESQSIHFIQVDDIWVELKKTRKDFGSNECREEAAKIMFERVQCTLESHEKVSLESTGVGYGKIEFINSLSKLGKLHLIKVNAPKDVCLERIHSRDNSGHTSMDDETINTVYNQCQAINLPYNLELNNNPFLTDDEIISRIKEI